MSYRRGSEGNTSGKHAGIQRNEKSGDVDPRCELAHCFTVSDKALAVGGGVLEAVLRLSKGEKDNGKQR